MITNEANKMFFISTEQKEKAYQWQKEHDQAKHIPEGKTYRYSGAIGGAYTYCITPTSIGDVLKIKCSCGDILDVSEYDQW